MGGLPDFLLASSSSLSGFSSGSILLLGEFLVLAKNCAFVTFAGPVVEMGWELPVASEWCSSPDPLLCASASLLRYKIRGI